MKSDHQNRNITLGYQAHNVNVVLTAPNTAFVTRQEFVEQKSLKPVGNEQGGKRAYYSHVGPTNSPPPPLQATVRPVLQVRSKRLVINNRFACF